MCRNAVGATPERLFSLAIRSPARKRIGAKTWEKSPIELIGCHDRQTTQQSCLSCAAHKAGGRSRKTSASARHARLEPLHPMPDGLIRAASQMRDTTDIRAGDARGVATLERLHLVVAQLQ